MHHLSEIPQNALHIVELIVNKTTFNRELVEFVVGWISRIQYKKRFQCSAIEVCIIIGIFPHLIHVHLPIATVAFSSSIP